MSILDVISVHLRASAVKNQIYQPIGLRGLMCHCQIKMKQLFQMLWTKIKGSKKVICALASEKTKDLIFIKELVEAGTIKSVIDRCYPLEQTAEAHRHIEKGHRRGHIVITVEHNNKT